MGKLVKMDLYRLLHSKLFWGMCASMFLILAVITFSYPFISEFFKGISANKESFPQTYDVKFTAILSTPTYGMVGWIRLLIFISAATFLYEDLKGGYIKNIAGQLPKRSYTVVSKFFVIVVHNFIFLAAGVMGKLLGVLACPKSNILFDDFSSFGFILFFVKLLLMIAMISMILFLTTGLRNKTLAIVLGVLLGVDVLNLLYIGVNSLVSYMGAEGFDLNNYTLDSLYTKEYKISSLSSGDAQLIINSVIVSVIVTVVFLLLTILMVNKRDIE